MIVELTGLNSAEGISKAGKPYTFLHVTGNKFDNEGNQEGPYDKKVVLDDQQALFNGFKVGDKVNIKNEPVAGTKFWNIVNVRAYGQHSGSPAQSTPAQAPTQASGPTQGTVEVPGTTVMSSDEMVRYESLDMAISFMSALLSANEKYKIYNARTTADLLKVDLLKLADEMGEYIRGEVDTVIKVNDDDLGEPAEALEDDIPF